MKRFRQDNTDGFSDGQLEILNAALAILAADTDPEDEDVIKGFCDRLTNAWLKDESENTPAKLVQRVDGIPKIVKTVIHDNGEFINVDATFGNGIVISFTRDNTQREWGFCGEDNASVTERAAKSIGVSADDFWEAVVPQLDAKAVPAAALGRKGGSVKSRAKSKASRENGKLGGRPKKKKK